jgi:diguanylate cyclase (GGDEF)-like protein
MDRLSNNIRVRDGARNLLGLKNQVETSKNKIKSLEAKIGELEPLVRVDAKTGALNDRGMWHEIWEKVSSIEKDTKRTNDGIGFVYYDLIQFHDTNNILGQENGDLIIKKGVEILKNLHRPEDNVVRYGGDEDLVMMRVGSFDQLENILTISRHDESGAEVQPILDKVKQDMKSYMQSTFPDFVEEHGSMAGTFRNGYCFVDHEEITGNTPEDLETLIRERLNEMTIRVKGHGGR